MKTPPHRLRYQHSEKGRATARAWRKANRDKVNAYERNRKIRNRQIMRLKEKRYREKHPDKWSAKLRRTAARQREKVSDGYVKKLLSAHGVKVPRGKWPIEMVRTMQAVIKLRRVIYGIKS